MVSTVQPVWPGDSWTPRVSLSPSTSPDQSTTACIGNCGFSTSGRERASLAFWWPFQDTHLRPPLRASCCGGSQCWVFCFGWFSIWMLASARLPNLFFDHGSLGALKPSTSTGTSGTHCLLLGTVHFPAWTLYSQTFTGMATKECASWAFLLRVPAQTCDAGMGMTSE